MNTWWAQHGRHALISLSIVLLAWIAAVGVCMVGSVLENANNQWVSVNLSVENSGLSRAQKIFFEKNDDQEDGVNQKGWALRSQEDFFEAAGSSAADCFAANACKTVSLPKSEWLRWMTSGRPPALLAQAGWEKQSIFSMRNLAMRSVACACAGILFLVFGVPAWIAALNKQRSESARRRLARILVATKGGTKALAWGVAVGALAWLALGVFTTVWHSASAGAHPARSALSGVASGRLPVKDAYWVSGELRIPDDASEDLVYQAKPSQAMRRQWFLRAQSGRRGQQKWETRGAHAEESRIRRKDGICPKPTRRLESRTSDCRVCVEFVVDGFLFFGDFLRKLDQMEKWLKRLAARGRPRIERAKLAAAAKTGRGGNGDKKAPKRPPRSL